MSDLAECYEGTNVTTADLAMIGAAVLDLIATTESMRHSSPIGTTDYALPDTIAQCIAWHFARWCSEGESSVSGGLLKRFVAESGWAETLRSSSEEGVA